MIQRTDQVIDEYKRPVEGAKIYVTTDGGVAANLTIDGSAPLSQPVITDRFGVYSYYADDGFYAEDVWFGGKLRSREAGIAIGNVFDSLPDVAADLEDTVAAYRDQAHASADSAADHDTAAQGSAASAANDRSLADTARAQSQTALAAVLVALSGVSLVTVTIPVITRAALKALDTSVGIAGYFDGSTWELADYSSVSTLAAADTAEGIYCRSTFNTAKVWVRKFDGPINLGWFELTKNATYNASEAAANTAAWVACKAVLDARLPNAVGMETIQPPAGDFWFADSGNGIAIDITRPVLFDFGSASATTFRFPPGVIGMATQHANSSGVNGKDAVAHSSAFGTIIRNPRLRGGFPTSLTEGAYHGIMARVLTFIENANIADFEGEGVRFSASATTGSGVEPPFGNVNGSSIDGSINRCRIGLLIDGPDANALTIGNLNTSDNRQAGRIDSSGTGSNKHTGGESAGDGVTIYNTGVGIGAAGVSDGTSRYGAIYGQEVGASTNAPTAGTDNTWWYYIGAGGVRTGFPLWTSGMLVRAGGPLIDDSIGSVNTFDTIYVETGVNQLKGQVWQGSWIRGGTLATWFFQNPAASKGTSFERSKSNGVIETGPCWRIISGALQITLGASLGNAANTILNVTHPTYAPVGLTAEVNASGTVTLSSNGTTQMGLTTSASTLQFGTGAAVTDGAWFRKMFVTPIDGNSANARRMAIDTAAPTSGAHGAGGFIFNRTATLGANFGWRCYAAGTPGSWEALYSGYGTSNIGYATGAGGAVTQPTSKATGVPLNKLSGQITMNAAALAAGAKVSFVVTNSTVAATDTIIVSVGSGGTANAYRAAVTAVGTGSFTITVENITAGSLSESPIINFAVIKAVAA